MQSNFGRSLSAVLKHEGGFVDHPADPGGATQKGITLANFRRFVKKDGTVADLKKITDAQVAKVYRAQFWDAVKGDDLPAGVDYCVFDFAVNSGPARAARYLQQAVGVKLDGKIGPVTLAAVKASDSGKVISDICDARMVFLKNLKIWPTFGKGWTRRVTEVRRLALELAGKKAAPARPESQSEAFPEKGARNNRIVMKVQGDLRALGYSEVGAVDGDFGPATEAAIMVFRRDNGLPVSGRIDNELLAMLVKAKPRVIAEERREASPETVREQAPEARSSWRSKISSAAMGWFSAIGAGLTWIVQNFTDARNSVKPVADFFGSIPLWAYGGLIALGFFTVWWMSRRAEHRTVDAYRAGERR